MSKDEFVKLHGETAWQRLVAPRKEAGWPDEIRANANAIVHYDIIGPVLSLLGFKSNSLLEAQLLIENQSEEKAINESPSSGA